MEKYIGTYHKSSSFIQNLLKKQICSCEILWKNNNPPGLTKKNLLESCRFTEICMQKPPWGMLSQMCHSPDLLKSACRNPPQDFFSNLPLCRFTEIFMQNPPMKGIVGNSAIVISTRHWEQHISFALGNFNLFQQTR